MTKPFRIGLVMTGAVSAGSYTAGVLDFLLEALDNWERAKQRHRAAGDRPETWTVPDHQVALEIITGTSAGALCAGLLGVTLGHKFTPKNGPTTPPAAENRLYDIWVKQARIEDLLTTTDLADGKIYSLLNSAYLTQIATQALQVHSPYQRPNYVSPRLELVATNGNLRGIDYSINYTGTNDYVLGMVNHADSKRFYINPHADAEFEQQGLVQLNPYQPTSATWTVELRDAILASAAFPLGFAARKLQQNPLIYHQQHWPIPQSASLETNLPNGIRRYNLVVEEGKIPPNFPELSTKDYYFAAVDGGIANDEPVEFARRRLAGDRIHNPRNSSAADATVVMIDPFPDRRAPSADYQVSVELFPVMTRLLKTLLDQARFKLAELILAQQPAVASRFMITPTRRSAPGQPIYAQALSASVLGMFGGFLTESFREHDFQLGRLNCQLFLKHWFLLDADNPIFNAVDDGPALEKFIICQDDPTTGAAPGSQRRMRAIIPLVDELQPTLTPPIWPRMSQTNLNDVLWLMDVRIHALLTTVLATPPADKSWQAWLSPAAWGRSLIKISVLAVWRIIGRRKLNRLLRQVITTELRQHDQLAIW